MRFIAKDELQYRLLVNDNILTLKVYTRGAYITVPRTVVIYIGLDKFEECHDDTINKGYFCNITDQDNISVYSDDISDDIVKNWDINGWFYADERDKVISGRLEIKFNYEYGEVINKYWLNDNDVNLGHSCKENKKRFQNNSIEKYTRCYDQEKMNFKYSNEPADTYIRMQDSLQGRFEAVTGFGVERLYEFTINHWIINDINSIKNIRLGRKQFKLQDTNGRTDFWLFTAYCGYSNEYIYYNKCSREQPIGCKMTDVRAYKIYYNFDTVLEELYGQKNKLGQLRIGKYNLYPEILSEDNKDQFFKYIKDHVDGSNTDGFYHLRPYLPDNKNIVRAVMMQTLK